ncbi:MAG: hybrid sensor histidine kinase/response regulator, partial [Leptospiraceae bacterium]|nr:hybrid sensor histidine kinase/response regulator [Leptospiraceae bacterium]
MIRAEHQAAQQAALEKETEARQAQEKVSADLKRMDQLKDAFLANTSHELRTPLAGIIGLADALIQGVGRDDATKINRNLQLIVHSARRLSNLVNDILDFERLRKADITLQLQPSDLHTAVDVVLTLSQPNAEHRELKLINEVPAKFPPVLADEARLEQILLNLINNAIKFSDRGTVRITAKISASNPQLAEIAVIDTGIGIPANEQAHIFESFTQVYPQTGRKASGTGLGLSITRRLVELHGGRIAVHSRPHEGATFTFTLPLAPIPIDQSLESTPDRSTDSQPARTARQSIDDTISIFRTDATLTIPRRQPTEVESNVNFEVVNENPADKQSVRTDSRQNTHPWILLVDDDPINLEVMHDHLQLARYKTRSTSDPLQARDILNTEAPPDLIVLDMMMPFISGLDLAREIRTQYDLLTVPILMVTARAHTADLLAAMDAGANDYITRPFEREEFIMRVQNLVELSRNRHLNLTSESRIIEATRLERARINSELHD